MRELMVMTLADLRLRVRNRTVLIFGLAVPLGLMVVFNAVFGGTSEIELEPVTIAASVPVGDQLGATLVDVLRSLDVVEVSVEEGSPEEVRQATDDGDAQFGLVVPDGFTEAVRAGEVTTVQAVEGDGSGLETDILGSVVDGTVDQMYAASVAARAGVAAGLSTDQVAQVARSASTGGPKMTLSEGRTADEQLTPAGSLVAGQAGLFLLFTVGFGVLALLDEREQGTLARLHSLPIPRGLIVTSKVLSGYVLGVFATTVLLLAGSWLFDVGFGDSLAVGVLVLAAVAAATSLTFIVARLARTAEQASLTQAIIAMVLGVAGGAFFPFQARGLAGQLLGLNPVAALQRGLGITSGGGGITDLAAPVALMLGFAVAGILISRLVPDRGAQT